MDYKGVAWVGNIYNKFEDMCLELEESMYQDTFNYIENQAKTVGESVKRFYSDVMQDLLPPENIETVKDSSKPNVEADLEEKPKPIVKLASKKVDNKNSPSIIEDLIKVRESEFAKEGQIDHFNDIADANVSNVHSPIDSSSSNSIILQVASSDLIKVRESEFAKEGQIDHFNDTADANVSNVHSSIDSSSSNSIILPVESNEKFADSNGCLDEQFSESANSDVSEVFNTGNLENCMADDETKEIDSTKDEELDMLKLDETCVLVDRDNLSLLSNKPDKRKSYKKKIREVFSSRKMSAMKHEYEQLAVQFGEIDLGTNQEHSQSDSERDWELL